MIRALDPAPAASGSPAPEDAAAGDPLSLSVEEVARAVAAGAGDHVDIDPDRIHQDLARLVLSLMEFLRQLLEAQAVRRVEGGRLSAEEEERLGLGLMRAREAVREVADRFGLGEEDLRLQLGPLGRMV